jgi:4-hydroxybenzoyl-CoA thioesterase
MTPASFARERIIRFSDCDPAGIVFYPQYFVMFNGLVEDWWRTGSTKVWAWATAA